MSIKIGELLVQRGVIGNEELQEALNAQLVYGGHLGTCLIELGHITETALGEVLSQIFDVGYATVEMLNGVLRNVTESVPRRLVEKHRLVPFQLTDGMLHVAMIDPKNIHGIDETAFATGHKIQPPGSHRRFASSRRWRSTTASRDACASSPCAASSTTSARSSAPRQLGQRSRA